MPNRIIKESICRSDSIDSLSWFEEVLFYRLIVVCDDFGRFDGRPAIIKGACFPLKDDITKRHISEAIERLSTVGLVRGYEVQGRPYLQLTTWDCHQQIRAKKSKYPSPDGTCNQLISDDCNSPRNRESKYGNRESYSRNGDARAVEPTKRFEEFLSAYPKDCNRYLTETAYDDLLLTGKVTEDELVKCAQNYAEACRIEGVQFMYNAENFLKKFVFEKYLPGRYKKPDAVKKTGFKDFMQNDYDFEQLEKEIVSN